MTVTALLSLRKLFLQRGDSDHTLRIIIHGSNLTQSNVRRTLVLQHQLSAQSILGCKWHHHQCIISLLEHVTIWSVHLSLSPRTAFWMRMTLSVMALSLSISSCMSWWSWAGGQVATSTKGQNHLLWLLHAAVPYLCILQHANATELRVINITAKNHNQEESSPWGKSLSFQSASRHPFPAGRVLFSGRFLVDLPRRRK